MYDPDQKPIPIDVTDFKGRGSHVREMQNAASIQIAADGYINCRKIKPGLGPYYLVTEILSRGIVAGNRCNRLTLPPKLGTLVLFVRPANWFEQHSREPKRANESTYSVVAGEASI